MDLSLGQSVIPTLVDALPLNRYVLFLQLLNLKNFKLEGDSYILLYMDPI